MPVALKVQKGYLKGRVLLIPEGRPFVIGSSLESDLVLFGKGVRDRHCAFVPHGDGRHRLRKVHPDARIEVDDEPLEHEQDLSPGSEIALGSHRLEYAPEGQFFPISSPLIEPFDDSVLPASLPCSCCGDRIGPDRDAFDPHAQEASLQALKVGDDVVCPRCIDRRLDAHRELGAYRILRKTGVNEREVTYLAVERETNRRVALRILKADKALDPQIARRFLVRALIGHQLRHPSFLSVLAVGASRGTRFVVMEQQDHAMKLERLLARRTPIPILDALSVLNQFAEAIRVGRETGLLIARKQRTGVLVTRSAWLKVQSYDVTRSLEERVVRSDVYQDLIRRSSDAAAQAPIEALAEGTEVSEFPPERVEIFSVGRLFFQLLTGCAFDLEAAKAAMARALKRPQDAPPEPRPRRERGESPPSPASLDHVPRPAIILFARLLARDDKDRLPSLEAVTRASKSVFQTIESDPRLAEVGLDTSSEAIEMSDEDMSADEGGVLEQPVEDE